MREEFYKLMEKRRSIRAYQETPISDEILERIGKSVSLAPSACNKQPYKVLMITNNEMLNAIRQACPQQMLENAPAIAVIIGTPAEAWHRPEGDSAVEIDVAIAMEHLILAATVEGLATCWICAYEMDKMNKALNLDSNSNVYALTPVGYAARPASSKLVRKEQEQVYRIIK